LLYKTLCALQQFNKTATNRQNILCALKVHSYYVLGLGSFKIN